MTLRFGGRALGTTLPMAAGGLVTRHPQMGTVEQPRSEHPVYMGERL
jgi:hypothetical protein